MSEQEGKNENVTKTTAKEDKKDKPCKRNLGNGYIHLLSQ